MRHFSHKLSSVATQFKTLRISFSKFIKTKVHNKLSWLIGGDYAKWD